MALRASGSAPVRRTWALLNQWGASGAASRRVSNNWSKAFSNCLDDSEVTLTKYHPGSLVASADTWTPSAPSDLTETCRRMGLDLSEDHIPQIR